MNMTTDLTFAESYLFEIARELPGGRTRVDRFGSQHGDGVIVEFLPGTPDAWIGVFAFGDLAPRAHTGVYALPDQRVLVVSRGTGYIVDPKRRSTEDIKPNPIMHITLSEEPPLVLVADPWSVFAYGETGCEWDTGRIAMDGLTLDGVEGGKAVGYIASAPDEVVRFSIDLTDGSCDGVDRLSSR